MADNPPVENGTAVEVQTKSGSRWRDATVAASGPGWVRVVVTNPTPTQGHGVYSRWRLPND